VRTIRCSGERKWGKIRKGKVRFKGKTNDGGGRGRTQKMREVGYHFPTRTEKKWERRNILKWGKSRRDRLLLLISEPPIRGGESKAQDNLKKNYNLDLRNRH